MKIQRYVVQITMRDGSKKYVNVQTHLNLTLVRNKAQASIMTNGIAHIVSCYFYHNAWVKEQYGTREVVYYKPRTMNQMLNSASRTLSAKLTKIGYEGPKPT